jgi:hypothetical protein
MKFDFQIVKIPQLSGSRATFYTAYLPDEGTTLFDQFLTENRSTHLAELQKVLDEIKAMATRTGARIDFFKKYEGVKIGEGVYALFSKKLRLYCFRIDNCVVILGGGGWKEVAKWQDDPKLTDEVSRIRFIASQIDNRIRERDIRRSNDDMHLIGDLFFNFDEDDFD